MPFNHTDYAHRTGRRSRPRSVEAMGNLLRDLDLAIQSAQAARAKHARKNLRSRTRDLQVARAHLEAAMVGARQEQARNSRDPARRRAWGPPLSERTKAARYEKMRLMKMLGEWK